MLSRDWRAGAARGAVEGGEPLPCGGRGRWDQSLHAPNLFTTLSLDVLSPQVATATRLFQAPCLRKAHDHWANPAMRNTLLGRPEGESRGLEAVNRNSRRVCQPPDVIAYVLILSGSPTMQILHPARFILPALAIQRSNRVGAIALPSVQARQLHRPLCPPPARPRIDRPTSPPIPCCVCTWKRSSGASARATPGRLGELVSLLYDRLHRIAQGKMNQQGVGAHPAAHGAGQ